jgi:hypothetical protein
MRHTGSEIREHCKIHLDSNVSIDHFDTEIETRKQKVTEKMDKMLQFNSFNISVDKQLVIWKKGTGGELSLDNPDAYN